MFFNRLSEMGLLLGQVSTAPSVALPAEWAAWIIGTLAVILMSIIGLVWKIAQMASQKTDEIVKEFKEMHRDAMLRAEIMKDNQVAIRDTQIRIETKQDLDSREIKKEISETKQSLISLNSSIRCKDG